VLLWTIYQEGFVFLRIGPASAMEAEDREPGDPEGGAGRHHP
jgi:hypothetical protein